MNFIEFTNFGRKKFDLLGSRRLTQLNENNAMASAKSLESARTISMIQDGLIRLLYTN